MRKMVMIVVLLFFVTTMCRSWWCGSCDEGIAASEGDGGSNYERDGDDNCVVVFCYNNVPELVVWELG